jgi:hypothetical protein
LLQLHVKQVVHVADESSSAPNQILRNVKNSNEWKFIVEKQKKILFPSTPTFFTLHNDKRRRFMNFWLRVNLVASVLTSIWLFMFFNSTTEVSYISLMIFLISRWHHVRG